MEYSIALASEVDSWRWVVRAEELGFSTAWFYDTQLLNPDVFVCMALAAHHTDRIRLGTGVLVPSNRIEPVTANALASLNKLAPGRIDFGVGTGFTARRTMGLGAMTLARVRTYIERVQTLLRGEVVDWDFEGEEHKIAFLNPDLGLINIEDDIALWLSAFGPKSQQLVAALGAGWINFAATQGAAGSLARMQQIWRDAGRSDHTLATNLFTMGAVLTGNTTEDEARLMAQGGPFTSVMFHNFADEMGAMGSAIPDGPLAEPLASYLEVHAGYEPADAKYLHNHRGHLMFVRPEERHITPDLVRATSMSGTANELVAQLRTLRDAGYGQVTIQLVHGHEAAIEDWAAVLRAV
ncbi:MAG: LLM class flavin-dependent oxidoreductase [Pseudomonadales bacterium]|jgi:5,10-methylenetetrahydromethanopterin reductase|nr:LLM class flavin-dependent oxidoreductase [Pseudomonadales bacterium]MDP6469901.1 LLM class flavin-dependent oxidoreductase [Pseudomonadales bacterium]MDP6827496.1 LLM class flavin-dependent oxidoreductase [Pseudomonadales bacterium]MDP6970763.1 LLM class flavin-dependent oxidoreductase [Pseudomonadales bacterium]